MVHTLETPTQDATAERPQCWECRRRRLVCDGTQPICSKCRTSGIVCPGYADKKPLTWLAPGQVMSRARRRKMPARESTPNPGRGRPNRMPPRRALTESGSDQTGDELDLPPPVELRPEVCDIFEAILYFNSQIYPEMARNLLGPSNFMIRLDVIEGVPPSIVHALVSVALSHRIMRAADSPASDQLVKPMWARLYRHRGIAIRAIGKMIGDESTRLDLATIISVYTFLFAMLQHSFSPCWYTHINGLMSLINLRSSIPGIIQELPEMHLSMMALLIVGTLANTTSPRDGQVQLVSDEEALSLVRTYFTETYYPAVPFPPELFVELIHINSLRAHAPSPEVTRAATLLLARIEAFSPEAWSAARPPEFQSDWQILSAAFHAATALFAILSLQSSGALPSLPASTSAAARSLPSYQPSSSPSSPPSSSCLPLPSYRHLEQGGDEYQREEQDTDSGTETSSTLTLPFHPPTRTLITPTSISTSTLSPPSELDPPSTHYHLAPDLDRALELDLARARHARTLFALLERGLAPDRPRVRKRLAWPLVVAGVEAARAGPAVQRYVATNLSALARELGCAPPAVARGVLERFWEGCNGGGGSGNGGGGRWDECFVEGVALVM